MITAPGFISRLEAKVAEQLKAQRVGYLLGAAESQFSSSRRSMERIAKEGRKYGVGLAVVSQRPHEVSETVLAQCGTFICLRITNPDDQGYVRSLVPESEGDLVSVLAGLGRGETLVLGEARPVAHSGSVR